MSKEYQKPNYTDSDIKQFAKAFDILLEGAIQNHLVDQHGKLSVTTSSIEGDGGEDD